MLDFDALLDAHKAQLGKAVGRFQEPDDADFARHLRLAAHWIDGRWPRIVSATLTLTAEVAEYATPADCRAFLAHDWGTYYRPWDESSPGLPPLVQFVETDTGPVLGFAPAPSGVQIQAWGATFRYRYRRAHVLTASEVTVSAEREADVLLAALIEAMRDLAAETSTVQLQRGLAGIPTAGTPAYLYEKLLLEWERR